MKRKFLPLFAVATVTTLCTSCLSDNAEEVTAYNDAGISAFTIGTLKQVIHTTSKSGADSTYTANFDASGYRFYIDQLGKTIYNADSLPPGVDITKVVCTVSTKNGGTLGLKNVDNDTVKYFVGSDSLDFTSPREFVVYNNSGTAQVSYKVTMNVHKEHADGFAWREADKNNSLLQTQSRLKTLYKDQTAYVFVARQGGMSVFSSPCALPMRWTTLAENVQINAVAVNDMVVHDGSFYSYDDGSVLKSDDGVTWTVVSQVTLNRLVGSALGKLYALSNSKELMVSADNGATWTIEKYNKQGGLLPDDHFNLLVQPLRTNANAFALTLIGTAEGMPVVWRKIITNDANADKQQWDCYGGNGKSIKWFPAMSHLDVVGYGEMMLAVGRTAAPVGGSASPVTAIYHSLDGGITWAEHATVVLPQSWSPVEEAFGMITDADNYLWLFNGQRGDVWRGRLNKMGWATAVKGNSR